MKLRLAIVLLCLVAASCADDTEDTDKKDAGATKDAGDDASTPATSNSARGKYLVESLGACGDCHTPRKPDGSIDTSKHLAGVDCFIDADPTKDDFGCLSSRNLTDHETGLKNRSDQEIKDMFMKGERPDGKAL